MSFIVACALLVLYLGVFLEVVVEHGILTTGKALALLLVGVCGAYGVLGVLIFWMNRLLIQ